MGDVRILDYAVCEDGGVLINPMIVDGQVIGGVAQGIGTALYEEMPFDGNGQPLATTLADYLLPGASEVPMLRIDHMETPSPYTEFGQKGIGEGGAIGPPAAIADGRTPDIGGGILARIAQGIAYRAVRNLGTIGGSLCHADPAADWLTTLTALGGSVLTWGETGGRSIPLAQFVIGAFRTALASGEIVQAVRVPRPSAPARWGYYKACRKPGEFAHAMAAVLDDPGRGIRRAVIGAVGGPPVVLEGERVTPAAAEDALRDAGLDAIARRMQAIALKRALAEAAA